jgi:flagellar biosynthesis chaperone FliJ
MATEVIVKRDLSRSLKSKYIEIPALPITVSVTLDDELKELAKSGKEGFRLQQLVDVANKAIDKWIDGFQSSIDSVDKKLPELSAGDIKDKIAELNDVLVKYSKQLETQVDKEVDAAWNAAVSRNKELRNYKFVQTVKVVVSLLTAAGNILSMAATAGADVVSALSLVNIAANLAAQFHRESMDMFKHYERVAKMMEDLDDTVMSDLNGLKDMAKSAVADASPVLARFVNSTKSAQNDLRSLNMKFIQADKDADEVVGKINQGLDKIGKIGKRGIDAKIYSQIEQLEKQVDEMLKDMVFTRSVINDCSKDLDDWDAALKAWDKRNPAKAKIKAATGLGKNASAVAGVVSAVLKSITAIKALV